MTSSTKPNTRPMTRLIWVPMLGPARTASSPPNPNHFRRLGALRSSLRMNFASSQISSTISGATLSAIALPGPYCSEPMAFS